MQPCPRHRTRVTAARTEGTGIRSRWWLLGLMISLTPLPAIADDCDGDGVSDELVVRADEAVDLNENGALDVCELVDGDLDLDERVDWSDLVLAMLDFGAGTDSPADLDRDGLVDFSDLCLLMMQFGPSPRASLPRHLLGDLLAGTSHLDIVLVGDSNATFADGLGARGYSGGFMDELSARGAATFATGLLPVAASGTGPVYPKMGSKGGSTGPDASITVCDTESTLDGWVRGSTVSTEIAGLFTPALGPGLRLDGRNIDWAYLPAGGRTAGHASEWISLPQSAAGTSAFGSQHAGAFRLVVARFEASATPDAERSPLELNVSEIGRPSFRAVASMPIAMDHRGAARIDACEVRYPAEPGRPTLSASYRASDDGTTGPVGVLYRSMYRTDGAPGFAVNVLQNWAGGNTGEIASSLDAEAGCGQATLRVYLRELADRQRAAGGEARVLVFVNMGVNNRPEAPADAHTPADAATVIGNIDRAWQSLGESTERLAFIVTASHDAAIDHYDPRATSAALRANLAGDRRIAVVDLDGLAPRAHLASIAGFAGDTHAPNAHLSAGGYQSVVRRVIGRVMAGTAYRPE